MDEESAAVAPRDAQVLNTCQTKEKENRNKSAVKDQHVPTEEKVRLEKSEQALQLSRAERSESERRGREEGENEC